MRRLGQATGIAEREAAEDLIERRSPGSGRRLTQIAEHELRAAITSLSLLRDDPYLRMHVTNLTPVPQTCDRHSPGSSTYSDVRAILPSIKTLLRLGESIPEHDGTLKDRRSETPMDRARKNRVSIPFMRGADGGDHRAGPDIGAASVALAFRRKRQRSDERCSRRCASWCCPASSATVPFVPRSSTTPPFPKQGRHSVDVARQYWTIARQWCRCRWPTITRASRWRIASTCLRSGSTIRRAGPRVACPRTSASRPSRRSLLDLMRWACAAGLQRGVGLLDAGYGVDATLRMGLSDLGIAYVAGALPNTLAWEPGTRPEPEKGAKPALPQGWHPRGSRAQT
jgi:DDE superfamily endonuclease